MSTVKRWVDAGELRAARTVGRHRLIASSEVLRFARERSLPTTDLDLPAGRVGGSEALATALRLGEADEARDLIRSAHAAGRDAAALADGLIRPAMAQIGHEWETGTLDVFQEHRATRIVEGALIGLIHRAPARKRPEAPLALGASAEGDPYTLPGLLAELTLRELGWEVINLGPSLPLPSLARAIRAIRPRLVWLSANHLADPDRFLAEYPTFARAAGEAGTALVVGGQALGPDLRARISFDVFGERMAQLGELARRLHPIGADSAPDDPTTGR